MYPVERYRLYVKFRQLKLSQCEKLER